MNENNLIDYLITSGQWSFFLELFFALVIFMANAKKRKLWWLRAIAITGISFPFYWLPYLNVGRFNISYMIVLVAVFVSAFFLYQEPFFPILLASVASWGLQHLAWNILGFVYDCIPNVSSLPRGVIILIDYLIFLILYLLTFFIIYKLKIKITYNRRQFIVFLFASIIIFIAQFLTQLIEEWNYIYRIYTSLVSLLALLILFGYPYLSDLVIKERNLQNEKENLEAMLELQASQQALSKQTTDILNFRFHDMKNQLSTLKAMKDADRHQGVEELQKELDIYSDIAQTGNEALDIVITQKSLLCSDKKIRLTYIIDGKSFGFMTKTDITSLFGNILDNAIEATDTEKGDYRLIKLKAYRQNSFLMIHEENYSSKPIEFGKDGLPVSTKKDYVNHGYGTKSIRYIVNKYGGQLKLSRDKDIFMLSILIPIPEHTEKQAA